MHLTSVTHTSSHYTAMSKYSVLHLTQGRIAVMDATQPANKIALKGESIVGYPSFVAYRNGFRVGVYDGPRTAK